MVLVFPHCQTRDALFLDQIQLLVQTRSNFDHCLWYHCTAMYINAVQASVLFAHTSVAVLTPLLAIICTDVTGAAVSAVNDTGKF